MTERADERSLTRRGFLGAAGVLGAAAASGTLPAQAAAGTGSGTAVVTGYVFEDRNGRRDPGERGIRGVSVSDGLNVVETDARGAYSIQVDPARRITSMVWATVPSGFGVPTNEYNTPQFYRKLEGLAAGEERRQDIGLLRDPRSKDANFSFINVADVHVFDKPSYLNNRELFAAQIRQLNEVTGEPAFVLIAGDLFLDATEGEYREYLPAAATSRLPIWTSVGNHDISFWNGSTYKERLEPYRRHIGPEWYSFDYGDRHFVLLEDWLGFQEPDQLQWLRADLAQNARKKQVVLVTHIQLNAPDTRESGTAAYVDLMSDYDTRLALSGHTHVNDVTDDIIPGAWNVNTAASGSNTNDMTPPGYRFIRFRGGEVEFPHRVYGVDRSLVLTSPAPGGRIAPERAEIQVNAYHTSSEVTGVRYRIDGGPWRRLRRTGAFTWAAKWGSSRLERGEHSILVRAEDDGGKTWENAATFRVAAPGEVELPRRGADWAQFHGGARHTGEAREALAPEGLDLAWTYRSGGSITLGSPSVADGTVYIGIRDEDGIQRNGIAAMDLETGRERWRFHTDAQVQATPAVEDGRVYAASVRGTLYAVGAASGEKLWEEATAVDKDGVQRGRMYFPAAAVDRGVVYQGYGTRAGSRLMALDGATGETRWDVALENDQFIAATPAFHDGKLYVVAGSRYLYALDAETGGVLWRKQPTRASWSHSVASLADGRIFVGFRTGILTALDGATGGTLWTYQSPDSARSDLAYDIYEPITPSSPAVSNGVVYMGFPDGYVSAHRAASGERLWSYRTRGGVMSSPAVSGDVVYVGSNDGNLYALDADTGVERWSFEIGAWVASSPAVSGNALIVGAFDGNLYAFTGRPGENRSAGVELEGATAGAMVGGRANPVLVSLRNASDSEARVTARVEAPEAWGSEAVTATVSPGSAEVVEVPVKPPPDVTPRYEMLIARVESPDARVYGATGEVRALVVPSGDAVSAALDSGGASSPVLATYDRLAPQDAWDPTKGYGWAGAAPSDRDRGAPDDLRRDFTLGRGAPTTLRLNVPAGRHEAFLLTGDAASDSGNTIVSSEGRVLAQSGGEVIPAGEFRWVQFELDGGASGRTVNLELTGALRDGHWRVNALVMLP